MWWGVLLLLFWTLFLEQSSVKKKKLGAEINSNQISFLTTFITGIVAAIVVFFQNNRTFDLNLLSFTLVVYQVLAAVIFYAISNKAVHYADRSTSAVLSTMAIPLLLLFDMILGYEILSRHIIGVIFLIVVLSYSFLNGQFSTKGIKYVIISNLISVTTITAFKYSVTYFTTTSMMNFLNCFFVSWLFFIVIMRTLGRKGIKQILKPKYMLFGCLHGIGTVLCAAAYSVMISSIVAALKRFLSMMRGILMWKLYFREDNVLRKLSIASLIGCAVAIMNIGPMLVNAFKEPEILQHASAESEPLVCTFSEDITKKPIKNAVQK